MIRATAIALVAALATIGTAEARNNHRGGGNEGYSGGGFCPPGLAKKGTHCMPPGLAKQPRPGDHYYDYPHDELDAARYNLDVRYGWYRLGDGVVVKTDRKTGAIVELFDALSTLTK